MSVGVIFFLFLISWFVLIYPLGRFFNLPLVRLAASYAVFFSLFFTLNFFSHHPIIPRILSDTTLTVLVFSLSLFAAVGCYLGIENLNNQGQSIKNRASTFGLALPIVFFELYILSRLSSKDIPVLSLNSFLIFTGFLVVVVLSIWLISRLNRKITNMLPFAFFAILILIPTISPLLSRSPEGSFESGHKIKNVVLITIDTLRASALSCYNQKSAATPYIDQLAADGVLFENAISPAPWTLPGLASIMTGVSPSVHQAHKKNSKLPEELQTLAEYMLREGYLTGALGRNGFLRPRYGLAQGFLEYNPFPKEIWESFGFRKISNVFPERFIIKGTTSELTQLAVNWIESNSEKDFFFWLHYLDPHLPYSPPGKFIPDMTPPPGMGTSVDPLHAIRAGRLVPSSDQKEWIKKLYEGEVRCVDENIGKLIDTLKKLQLYDGTMIILTSDHGEEFWEHGGFEHGHSLYNELLHVPLIIKLPLSKPSASVPEVVSTQCIMATTLELCGIEYHSDDPNASSLSPYWGPEKGSRREDFIISTGLLYFEDQISVIDEGMKYIRTLTSDRETLFNLRDDPEEEFPIPISDSNEVEHIKNTLKEHYSFSESLRVQLDLPDKSVAKLDPSHMQMLRALGYIE
jgi:arylsulfatase A-like enzyme